MTKEEAIEAVTEAYGNSEYTDEIIKALEQEPRKGQWITNSDYPDTLICDNCGARFDMWKHERKFMHYCPNCGADMREGESEVDNGNDT